MKEKYRGFAAITLAIAASIISTQGVGSIIEGNASPTLPKTYYEFHMANPGATGGHVLGTPSQVEPTGTGHENETATNPNTGDNTEQTTAETVTQPETRTAEEETDSTVETSTHEETTSNIETSTHEETTEETTKEPTKEETKQETKESSTEESSKETEPETTKNTEPETNKDETRFVPRKSSGNRKHSSFETTTESDALSSMESSEEEGLEDSIEETSKQEIAPTYVSESGERVKRVLSSKADVESSESPENIPEASTDEIEEAFLNETTVIESETKYITETKEDIKADVTEANPDKINNNFNKYDGVTLLAAGVYAGWVAIVLLPMVNAVKWINRKRREKLTRKE